MMGEFGFSEMVLIVIVAIVVYGKDLPQAARKLASLYTRLRRQLTDIKDEVQRQIPMDEIKDNLKVDLPNDLNEPQVEIPMAPTGIMAQVADAGKVLVTWDSVPGAATYTLKRSTSSSDPLLIVSMGLTDLSYTDGGLEPGATYHYVVTAQNTAGESGTSEEAVVTLPAETAAAAPAPAEAKPPGNGSAAEPAAASGEPLAPSPSTPEAAASPATPPAAPPEGDGSAPEPATKTEEPPAA